MKNTLTDLQNHFFAQLERLGNEDLTPEELQLEVTRSKTITSIGMAAVANARLQLDAQIHYSELPKNFESPELPKLLS